MKSGEVQAADPVRDDDREPLEGDDEHADVIATIVRELRTARFHRRDTNDAL